MFYARGLDGVRALAVLAVMVYHLDATKSGGVLSGGFLGVDVFFVLSGFLITSLLMVEFGKTGRISVKDFYLRRARRLLPALFLLLAVTGVIVAFWYPAIAGELRWDLLAALGYVTNWWLIGQQSSYFDSGGPSEILTHLWSLAVEEQFYLLWPLLLLALLRWKSKRSHLLLVCLTVVGLSALAAALLYDPFADPSRVYYGTDTRLVAPMLGAALAIAVRPWEFRSDLKPARRALLDVTGLLALLALAAAAIFLTDTGPELYRGGMLVVAVLSAGLVLSAGHPATWLGKGLSTQPLRWLGQRSYAVYLWHWPIILLTPANPWLRIGLTLAAAELSHWLVERPVRELRWLRFPSRAAAASVAFAVVAAGIGWQLTAVAQPKSELIAALDPAPDITIGALVPASASPSAKAILPGRPTAKPRQGPMKVTIFGDSQGLTLALDKPVDITKYLTLSDSTKLGCTILSGTGISSNGYRNYFDQRCGTWKADWSAKLTQHRPEVALVIIGAFDVLDLQTPQGTLTFGSKEWDANYSAALREAVDVLKSKGAKVALSLVPCYRPVETMEGYIPERGDDNRTRHLNELFRRMELEDPFNVFALEPPAEFCTDPGIGESTAYRRDGVHYLKPGSALYFKAITPQLLAIPSNL